MKPQLVLAFGLLVSVPVVRAQHPEGARGEAQRGEAHAPRANQGHIPAPPPRRDNPHAKPEVERHENGKINQTQHVNNGHWYGHDAPNDKRFHVDHPFEHGRFEHVGASFRYRIERIDRDHHRFWFPGGFWFEVASWDWPVCADWCWDCDDDFVIYDDPDHVGWYMLYNVHTGVYVHVMYMGS
jgi:hypothetical protein